jgi:hypothetical protein
MTVHTIALRAHLAGDGVRAWIERQSEADKERGSHTTDVLLWAIAIIVVVGIAVVFLTGYVNKLGAQLLGS